MYEITMINEQGNRFTKYFNSEYLYRQFLNKAKRSKKLIVVSYGKAY